MKTPWSGVPASRVHLKVNWQTFFVDAPKPYGSTLCSVINWCCGHGIVCLKQSYNQIRLFGGDGDAGVVATEEKEDGGPRQKLRGQGWPRMSVIGTNVRSMRCAKAPRGTCRPHPFDLTSISVFFSFVTRG